MHVSESTFAWTRRFSYEFAMGLSNDEINNIQLASIIVSVFSFIGSSFICICWLRYLHLRRFAFTL